MTALTADRDTKQRNSVQFQYPCAASEVFYKGQIVVLDSSGNAEAGTTATGKICVGISREAKTATAVAAATKINVESGCFHLENSSTDPVTKADIGSVVYIEDDQTICKTSTSKSVAGYMTDIDSEGVWVLMHHPSNANPSAALLVANNLSDVANAATARDNIGANQVTVVGNIADMRAATADVIRIVAPVAGDIDLIYSVIDDALATGDSTLTFSIGGAAITTGVITVAESGSAAGDVDTCSPSAAKTVAAGDVIECTVSGTNTANIRAKFSLLITT